MASLIKRLLFVALALPSTVLAQESINDGISVRIPSVGQRNWGTLFKDEFAKPISGHDHTGSGKGAQLPAGAFQSNSVTGDKIRLQNNQALRARNSINTADIDLLKLNTGNVLEFSPAVSFQVPVPVASGGTGASDTTTARANLQAAKSGSNSDITSLNSVAALSYTPTVIACPSGGSISSVSVRPSWYTRIGDLVFFRLRFYATVTASNLLCVQVSLPLASSSLDSDGQRIIGYMWYRNLAMTIPPGQSYGNVYNLVDTAPYTNGETISAEFEGFYRVQ